MMVGRTVSVLCARPALAALDERGIDAESVLRTAGLSRAALADIETRPPWDHVRRFWDAAAAATQDRYFGLHVGEAVPVGALELVDYLMATSANVGESIRRLSRYMRLLYDELPIDLHCDDRYARIVARTATSAPQYAEFAVAFRMVRSRQATAVDWSPERITFQHAGRDDGGELARVFRCPVRFAHQEIELRFAPEILALPHVRGDSRLLDVLTRYADSLLTAMPEQSDLVGRVNSAIARQMAKALPTLESTAADVRIPERTLQRRLTEAGVTHFSLQDQVRRDLALRYIVDARLGIAEIAYLLHFKDVTGFYRAFKRWTDRTPLDYRKQLIDVGRPMLEAERPSPHR